MKYFVISCNFTIEFYLLALIIKSENCLIQKQTFCMGRFKNQVPDAKVSDAQVSGSRVQQVPSVRSAGSRSADARFQHPQKQSFKSLSCSKAFGISFRFKINV